MRKNSPNMNGFTNISQSILEGTNGTNMPQIITGTCGSHTQDIRLIKESNGKVSMMNKGGQFQRIGYDVTQNFQQTTTTNESRSNERAQKAQNKENIDYINMPNIIRKANETKTFSSITSNQINQFHQDSDIFKNYKQSSSINIPRGTNPKRTSFVRENSQGSTKAGTKKSSTSTGISRPFQM